MEKSIILEEIRNKPNHCVEVKFGKEDDFFFKIICSSISINDFCFRDVADIHFCGDTMWIGEKVTIDVDKVQHFRIHSENWLVGDE